MRDSASCPRLAVPDEGPIAQNYTFCVAALAVAQNVFVLRGCRGAYCVATLCRPKPLEQLALGSADR